MIEDERGCDVSVDASDEGLGGMLFRSMRSAAVIAIEAVQSESAGHRTMLVQVEDVETGERAVAEIMISTVVNTSRAVRH